MKYCIVNGLVVNPMTNTQKVTTVLIEDTVITGIANDIVPPADCEIIDATGCWVTPGLIDLHVHFREPGQEYKEDIKTGSAAAAHGGFTTVCQMPNTSPVLDNAEILRSLQPKIKEAAVKVLTVGAITCGLGGQDIADFEAMKPYICAVSEDGKSVMDSGTMLNAIKKAYENDLTVFSHTEDRALVQGGAMNEGKYSREYAIKGIPPQTESIIAIRDILLANSQNCPIHICHVSKKETIDLIAWAKGQGMRVTAETAPHYFLLTERDVLQNGTPNSNWKMNPPLGSEDDRNAVLKGIKDKTIDVIATDHAPHSREEKAKEIGMAPFGIVGIETVFALCYTNLVKTNILTPNELIAMMSWKPAEILNRGDIGEISIGKCADIAIFDVGKEYIIDVKNFKSKSGNTPFEGVKVFGETVMTMVDGKIVYKR